MPLFFFLPTGKQGRGVRGVDGAWPAALGRGGGREEGEKRPGGARSRSPSPISEEGPHREGCSGCGRGGWAAAVGSAGGGSSERALVGEREREERGLHSPAHLGRMQLEEVARLGPVGGGGGERGGGGAGRARRRRAVALRFVGAPGCSLALFIGEVGRWKGRWWRGGRRGL